MRDFSTTAPLLFYSFTLPKKEAQEIQVFLDLLEKSGVSKIINTGLKTPNFGRPTYNPYNLFAAILLAFCLKKSSLRSIEEACKFDVRFMFILGEEKPDYTTFARFINKIIKPHREEIFSCITKAIFKELHISMDTCFIDGTKQEAKPNKYKYVWKPTTFHKKLCNKVRAILGQLNLEKDLPNEEIFASAYINDKIGEVEKLKKPEELPLKAFDEMKRSLVECYIKAVEYETKEQICGPYRNSYYKTDHDATAMCLKSDYYSGLGSNMHPAYSVQLLVSHGFITTSYTSQERADLYTFIDTLNLFHSMYGIYPKRIGGDAGYGNEVNYMYCKDHNIKGFLKFQTWEGEKSGRRPALYELNNNDTITCLGGRTGYPVILEHRHPRSKNAQFFKVCDCNGCPFMLYCRQFMKEATGDEKIFEVQKNYVSLKQEARDLLLTPEGIEMRVNRSCQVEGVFGVLKSDRSYSRIRRTKMDNVKLEIMLESLGYNLFKFINLFLSKQGIEYWHSPIDLKPEKFKKPSAKRLAKRAEKIRLKISSNQTNASYKYQKIRRK